jgi:hypothetical protein
VSGEFYPHETYFFSLLKYGATSSKMPTCQLIKCERNLDEIFIETGLISFDFERKLLFYV